MGDMGFGPALDFAGNLFNAKHAEEMQDDAQTYGHFEALAARYHSAEEAQKQRDFQERMSNTAVQRQARDIQAAGFNPMLSIMHMGGASTPPGAMGQVAQGSAGIASPGHWNPISSSMASASTIQVNDALADKVRAEADEIRERTPTHGVNIERMQQEIKESVERIEKIRQDVRTGVASAAHMDQQVRNLQEAIPQLRASTAQLKSLERLNDAQRIERLTASGVNEAQAKEINQRIKQDLPRLEAALKDLERIAMQMEQPGRMADEAAKSSFVGQIGAYLKALLPLQGIMGAIPIGRGSRQSTPHYTPRTIPGHPGERR